LTAFLGDVGWLRKHLSQVLAYLQGVSIIQNKPKQDEKSENL
jgi:hypothetical protein